MTAPILNFYEQFFFNYFFILIFIFVDLSGIPDLSVSNIDLELCQKKTSYLDSFIKINLAKIFID